MNRPNILFVGKMGTGKSILADKLRDNLQYKIISFAFPLKVLAKEKLGYEDKSKRYILQRLGTLGRFIDEDLWVKMSYATIKYFEDYIEGEHNFVIPDTRYANEVDFFKMIDKNWIVIKLVCYENIRFDRLEKRDGFVDKKRMNHSSETELEFIQPDYLIDTSGNIEDNYEQLMTIIDKELNKKLNKYDDMIKENNNE